MLRERELFFLASFILLAFVFTYVDKKIQKHNHLPRDSRFLFSPP